MGKQPISMSTTPPRRPIQSPVQSIVQELYDRFKTNDSGDVATYIPELGKANPDWFAICVVTADGAVYEVGDVGQTFTIQSISKPFTYGVALEDNGKENVLKKIWMEPSGEAFNSISLQPGTGRPLNPMINAGAIATTGLVEGKTSTQKMHRILDAFSRFAGRKLEVDQEVYRSESETGHRNRAIAYMLRNFDILTEDPTPALEAYFQQCSILVNCRDLAFMGATLANGGVNPQSGQRAVAGIYVENMLSVMSTCGMYDAAGEWIYDVGLPAKSGVAGGVLAVLPGQLSIAVFSPRLDSHGNSVRGIEVCRELSRRCGLHLFRANHPARSVVRSTASVGEVGSKRMRSATEHSYLRENGGRARLITLQGELGFAAAESAVRHTLIEAEKADYIVLDFRQVQSVSMEAIFLMHGLAKNLRSVGKRLLICGARGMQRQMEKIFQRGTDTSAPPLVEFVTDRDLVLEQLEGELLDQAGIRNHSFVLYAVEDCEMLAELNADQHAVLAPRFRHVRHAAGDIIVRAGDTDRSIHFVLQGKADAVIELPGGAMHRVATFGSGMCFGEMSLLDASPRSATVVACGDMLCASLSEVDFDYLQNEHPAILVNILRNVAKMLSARLRRANQEIRATQSQ
jgi:glutaminase